MLEVFKIKFAQYLKPYTIIVILFELNFSDVKWGSILVFLIYVQLISTCWDGTLFDVEISLCPQGVQSIFGLRQEKIFNLMHLVCWITTFC